MLSKKVNIQSMNNDLHPITQEFKESMFRSTLKVSNMREQNLKASQCSRIDIAVPEQSPVKMNLSTKNHLMNIPTLKIQKSLQQSLPKDQKKATFDITAQQDSSISKNQNLKMGQELQETQDSNIVIFDSKNQDLIRSTVLEKIQSQHSLLSDKNINKPVEQKVYQSKTLKNCDSQENISKNELYQSAKVIKEKSSQMKGKNLLHKNSEKDDKITLKDYLYQTQISSKKALLRKRQKEAQLMRQNTIKDEQKKVLEKKKSIATISYRQQKYESSKIHNTLENQIQESIREAIQHLEAISNNLSGVSKDTIELNRLFAIRRMIQEQVNPKLQETEKMIPSSLENSSIPQDDDQCLEI